MVKEFSNGTQSDNTEYNPPTISKDLTITNEISDNYQIEWRNLKMGELKIKNKFVMLKNENFENLRNNSLLFVDRSLLILEILNQGSNPFLITYPRRTGKTVNLTMLQDFCEYQVNAHGEHDLIKQKEKMNLFLGNIPEQSPLKIAQYCSNEKELLFKDFGKYSVVYFDLSEVNGDNVRKVRKSLKVELSKLFQKKKYLLEKLDPSEKKTFLKYLNGTIDESEINSGIYFLSQFLYQVHGLQVVVLIDEYDKYVNNLLGQPTVDYNLVFKVAQEISRMLNAVGKNKTMIKNLIMTGIHDSLVREDNSGFNNLTKLGISNQDIDGFYGLTEEEVMEKVTLIVDPDQDKYEEKINLLMKLIKFKYNGYQGYTLKYYNIWSVYCYLHSISRQYSQQKYIEKPSSFWALSGFSTTLSSFMETQLDSRLKYKFLNIALGQSQRLEYNESKVSILKSLPTDYLEQEYLYSYLLLNQGYITRSQPYSDLLDNNYFKIPNDELKEEFNYILERNLRNSLGITQDIQLGKAFISRNQSQIQVKFEEYLQMAMSFRDRAKKSTKNLQTTPITQQSSDKQKITDLKLNKDQNPDKQKNKQKKNSSLLDIELSKIECELSKLESERSKLEIELSKFESERSQFESELSEFVSEQYYHTITIGFLSQMKNYYGINSEFEAGHGYSDIIMLPKNSQDKHAFLLELQLGPKIKPDGSDAQEQLTTIAKNGIAQIKSKCYDAFLLRNGFKNYSYVGIAFSGKYVKVIVEDHLTNK